VGLYGRRFAPASGTPKGSTCVYWPQCLPLSVLELAHGLCVDDTLAALVPVLRLLLGAQLLSGSASVNAHLPQ
jgi:hypothetical protein